MSSLVPTGNKNGEFLFTVFAPQEAPAQEMQRKSVNLDNLIKAVFFKKKEKKDG